eukprot:scaffold14772_cov73-Attheya_sp.AAC.2
MDGVVLGSTLGDIEFEGETLGSKDGYTLSLDKLGSVVGILLSLGPMLGAEGGSMDIDVVDEGLFDGPILCVGGSLEFSLGESDTVDSKLPLKEGPIDADGIPLIFVVGEILTLGPMLGLEPGSNDFDGCNEGDGGVVVITDGSVLTSVGLTLGSSVGKCKTDGSELTFGWWLGGEVGPVDNVGFDEGSSLCESIGPWLGLCDTDGCMLGLEF